MAKLPRPTTARGCELKVQRQAISARPSEGRPTWSGSLRSSGERCFISSKITECTAFSFQNNIDQLAGTTITFTICFPAIIDAIFSSDRARADGFFGSLSGHHEGHANRFDLAPGSRFRFLYKAGIVLGQERATGFPARPAVFPKVQGQVRAKGSEQQNDSSLNLSQHWNRNGLRWRVARNDTHGVEFR